MDIFEKTGLFFNFVYLNGNEYFSDWLLMKRLFFILYALLTASAAVLSGKEQFIYTQISRKEGLTSTVNCIYKEKDGDVWLGTPNGLYRFNGYELIHFTDSLTKDREIYRISKDKNGNFWVLTNDWVLCRKAGEEDFSMMKEDRISGRYPFHSLCYDDDGIWFGSYGKIFRYHFGKEELSLFCNLEDNPGFICRDICSLDDSTLLCCSHSGSVLIDKISGQTSPSPYHRYSEISAAMIDSKGRIWMAYYNQGIEVLDKEGNSLKRYETGNSALSSNVVLCFTERGSTIWAGTDGGGINIIDPETDVITSLTHIAGDPSSLPAHSIKSIYTDQYDNIWVGSIREGLIRVSRSGMKSYKDCHIGLSSGLSNPTVLCLHQESDSRYIWIGTDGEGLNRFNPETNEFKHFACTFKTKVVSIASYSKDELALSVYADRVWLFDKRTGMTRPLKIEDNDINYLMRYAGRSLNLSNTLDGRLLLLSNTLKVLGPDGKCSLIPTDDGKSVRGNLMAIGRSDAGLWMHDNKSIYLLPPDERELVRKCSSDSVLIRSGHLGKDGIIWIATNIGLHRCNAADGSIIATPLTDEASSVVCDRDSRVWVGTDEHLYAYLPDQGGFTIFGESDGAVPNEYLPKPRLLSNEGDVYMGGVQGLLSIDAGYMIDEQEEPQIVLNEMIVDNEKIYADRQYIYEVPASGKAMTISVSTKERDIFRKKIYRFSFSGEDKVYETRSPSLKMYKIPDPGKYDVYASCTRRNGDWTTPKAIMTIYIPKPWYMRGWFICSALIFIVLIAGIIISSIIHRKTSRLKIALKEQEQKVYEEKVRMLINMSHELRTPLTLIMAPLKRLLGRKTDDGEDSATLHRIYRQSKRMKDLLDMVLDLRKMEVGKRGLSISRADFNGWITECVNDIIEEENAEGIRILTEFDPSVGLVDFDKRKCDTVLTNILMNAIKHSSKGDCIMLRTSLTGTGYVRVSISDEGPGLGDIDRSKMFTRFYQSNSEQYGSGIGLSYSRILVELHKGSIGAENNPDKGATFWWEIPLRAEEESQDTPKAYLNELIGHNTEEGIKIPATSDFSTSRMKLMLVDDNQDLLDFLREAMTGEFAEVMTLTGGNSALSLLRKGILPDIIVSDVNMPDGDGYSLCAELKRNEKFSHIPIVLLTARGEQEGQSDSYRIGADAFLAKPFEVETLLEVLKSLLRKKNEIRRKYLDNEEKGVSDYGSNEESFILKLNRIVSEHISDPELDQQVLCRELGISRASLYNKMKSITGAGAKEYITKIRIEKAKRLIEEDNMTLAEISDMTGFASQSYFSTAFKGYTGLTPSQYRQQHKKK